MTDSLLAGFTNAGCGCRNSNTVLGWQKGEQKMTEETKIKSVLLRTFIALVLCLGLIILKFVLKDEKIVEDLYNYLTTDIVFLVKM